MYPLSSIDGSNTEDQRNAAHGNTDRSALIGCRKCGYPGHMTYECRNGVKTGSSSYAMIHCDISSTSSDDEDVRMLRELKGQISYQLKMSVTSPIRLLSSASGLREESLTQNIVETIKYWKLKKS